MKGELLAVLFLSYFCLGCLSTFNSLTESCEVKRDQLWLLAGIESLYWHIDPSHYVSPDCFQPILEQIPICALYRIIGGHLFIGPLALYLYCIVDVACHRAIVVSYFITRNHRGWPIQTFLSRFSHYLHPPGRLLISLGFLFDLVI